MEIIEILIAFIIVIVAGFLIGKGGAKFSKKLQDRRIRKEAEKFLRGERENKIYLDDGRVLDVHKFTTFDEKGNKVQINLKGGIKIENVEEKNKIKRDHKRRIQTASFEPPRKNDGCPRKKKRDTRRIRRRFG